MDIQYLLFLQDFRNSSGGFLAPFMLWISDFTISFWIYAIMAMFYWVINRKAGKRILFAFHISMLFNGLLKLIFCVYRPWIRDPRIVPFGNAITTATGYSFPSGHSTMAASVFGGFGVWFKKKGWLLPACFAWLTVLAVMLSRNFLGVHTPQDVVIGLLSSILAIYLAEKIEDWTNKDSQRDLLLIVAGLLVCATLALFYEYKSYPLDYLANGKLLVDPARMKSDSYCGLGCVAGYIVARYFERRCFDFDQELSRPLRFVIGLVALVPLYLLLMNCIPLLAPHFGKACAEFVRFFMLSVYIMNFVPLVMYCVSRLKD